MSVNLSEYCSHPGYPYEKHIGNIADSFPDPLHKEIAHFHDAGKLSDKFQNGVLKGTTKTTHALEGAFVYFADCCKQKRPLARDVLTAFWTIAAHHTGLDDYRNFWESRCTDYEELVYVLSDFEENLAQVMERLYGLSNFPAGNICEWFDENKEQIAKLLKEPFGNFFIIRESFSRLIFADRYEAIFKESFHDMNMLDTPSYKDKLKVVFDKFSAKGGTLTEYRNAFRETILTNYYNSKGKRFFIVEAPTGIGKTLTALDLALHITKDKKKKRIITSLPMTSIIDQTQMVYSEILGEDAVLKDHYLADTKNYDDHIDIQKNDFLMNSWANDGIIVTTFNRLFNALFSVSNSDIFKFWTLRDSVVILDEVQTIPRVLIQDVARVLDELSFLMNIDFIVMSATVPEIKRFLAPEKIAVLSSDRFFQDETNNRYILQYDENIPDTDSLIEAVMRAYRGHQSVLCVVNTKKTALQVYKGLKKYFSSELYLLSGYFLPCERERILKEIGEKLGGEKLVLVSTQVVEAGVDLDFDQGFREFAPFSSIIQTAGRINREGKNDPSELTVFPLITSGPYHKIDMCADKVIPWLKQGFPENKLFNVIRQYFKNIIESSNPDPLLLQDIKNLNYKTVSNSFRNNFMTDTPFYVKVFVEICPGLYEQFDEERKMLLAGLNDSDELSRKMRCKVRLRKMMNKLSKYIINVSKFDVVGLSNLWDLDDLYICFYDHLTDYYNVEKGWSVSESSSLMF